MFSFFKKKRQEKHISNLRKKLAANAGKKVALRNNQSQYIHRDYTDFTSPILYTDDFGQAKIFPSDEEVNRFLSVLVQLGKLTEEQVYTFSYVDILV